MLPVLNNANRLRKVSLQRIHYKCLFKVKTKNVIYEGAPMKNNSPIVPALNLPDNVWFLAHAHPLASMQDS
jgi:hypothetical protein